MEDREFQKKIEYTKIMLEEYRTLRSEIINKQTLINNIVNFSFAIIGATLIAIANVVKQEVPNECGFILIATAVIIPFVCWFAFVQYYLEFIYTARISRYIVAIEDNINEQFGEHLLFWESGIREWKSYHVPQKIDKKIKQLHEFMRIEDELVRKLLILPLTFFVIAISSAIFSLIYGLYLQDSRKCYDISKIKIIAYSFMCLLFFFGIYLWFRLEKVVNKMHWSDR